MELKNQIKKLKKYREEQLRKDKFNLFYSLISNLNSDIICSCYVAAFISESNIFKMKPFDIKSDKPNGKIYSIGEYNGYDVSTDPYMRYNDLKILDKDKNIILDLTKYNLTLDDIL